MKRVDLCLRSAILGLLCGSVVALAQTAPPLGVLQQFSVLGNSG